MIIAENSCVRVCIGLVGAHDMVKFIFYPAGAAVVVEIGHEGSDNVVVVDLESVHASTRTRTECGQRVANFIT